MSKNYLGQFGRGIIKGVRERGEGEGQQHSGSRGLNDGRLHTGKNNPKVPYSSTGVVTSAAKILIRVLLGDTKRLEWTV